MVSFEKLIGGGSLGTEAEVRGGQMTEFCGKGEQGWRVVLPLFQCPPCCPPTMFLGLAGFAEQ